MANEKESMELGTFGSFGVGKTCIVVQFVKQEFLEDHDPTMEDFYETSKKVGDKVVDLTIYDTSGNEQYTSLAEEHMQTVEGYFLIYSVTDVESFNKLEALHKKVSLSKKTKNIPIVLIGNKCDLVSSRKVSTEQGKQLAEKLGCAFIETSAKTRLNIAEAFEMLVNEVRRCRSLAKASASNSPSSSKSDSKGKKKNDCTCQ
jgi:GTPase KRas protein